MCGKVVSRYSGGMCCKKFGCCAKTETVNTTISKNENPYFFETYAVRQSYTYSINIDRDGIVLSPAHYQHCHMLWPDLDKTNSSRSPLSRRSVSQFKYLAAPRRSLVRPAEEQPAVLTMNIVPPCPYRERALLDPDNDSNCPRHFLLTSLHPHPASPLTTNTMPPERELKLAENFWSLPCCESAHPSSDLTVKLTRGDSVGKCLLSIRPCRQRKSDAYS